MNATVTSDRLEFGPPPTPGALRSFALAVLAHAFLVAALTLGVQWRREAVTVTAEAELWSAVPQQAAPALVEVAAEPAPPPPPVVAAPVEPAPAEVDIALQREKLRLKNEKLERDKQQRIENEKQRLKAEKLALEKQRLLDKQAALNKQKLAQEKQRKDALQAQQDAKRLDGLRQENLKRMSGLAGASGAEGSTGTALKSSGPSASYAGKIIERIKSNTKFSDPNAGKPMVKVMVRVNSGGSILSRGIVNSSGNKAWEDAVLRAIDKMETLPRDTDGTIPAIVIREGLELTVTL
jgi:colicin import membrane protein